MRHVNRDSRNEDQTHQAGDFVWFSLVSHAHFCILKIPHHFTQKMVFFGFPAGRQKRPHAVPRRTEVAPPPFSKLSVFYEDGVGPPFSNEKWGWTPPFSVENGGVQPHPPTPDPDLEVF